MCDDHDLTQPHAGDLRCDGHRRHDAGSPDQASRADEPRVDPPAHGLTGTLEPLDRDAAPAA